MLDRFFGLAGRRALVTGGGSGIGAAVTRALAEAGAKVVTASDRAADNAHIEEECREAGLSVIGLDCRLGERAASEALQAEAERRLGGPIDILVSNAGIEGPVGATGTAETSAYLRLFDINLHAAYWLAAACREGMRKTGGGTVILMSSLSALRGNAAIGPYAMSKAALVQMARNLAVEWGPDNIRVNAVAPGLIATPFSEGLRQNRAFMERRLGMTPLRRVGTADEVAATVLYLAGAGGAFTTGQVLTVDGGTLVTDGG